MSASEAPPALAASVQRVKVAARQFIVQIDVTIAVIKQPNSDYIAASGAPNPYDLYRAVAEVDCWPKTPVDSGHGLTCS
jgi:hypothetical protein